MITERTLRRWRKDALQEQTELIPEGMDSIKLPLSRYLELHERILRMTQDLLDLHLMRKGQVNLMAAKKEELKAWKRLKEAFPGKFLSLELIYHQYSSGNDDTVVYHAYVEDGILSKESRFLKEVVDDLIEKAGKVGVL